jgi:predicted RNase H-like nuclease (RuvC/YqgF family)
MIEGKVGNDELYRFILELQTDMSNMQTDMSNMQKEKERLQLMINQQASKINSLELNLKKEGDRVIILQDEIRKVEEFYKIKITKLYKDVNSKCYDLLIKDITCNVCRNYCAHASGDISKVVEQYIDKKN